MLLFNCIRICAAATKRHYFNTSNVTIQLLALLSVVLLSEYFNTSNVTIQPYSDDDGYSLVAFQYI